MVKESQIHDIRTKINNLNSLKQMDHIIV